MLQDRQLVGVVAHLVDQAGQQHWVDAGAAHAQRAGDGRAALLAPHARHQVLAAVDGLGQAIELGALAQKVGAHGDDHEHRQRAFAGLVGNVEQQVDEGGGGLARAAGVSAQRPVAEQLFELVDYHH